MLLAPSKKKSRGQYAEEMCCSQRSLKRSPLRGSIEKSSTTHLHAQTCVHDRRHSTVAKDALRKG